MSRSWSYYGKGLPYLKESSWPGYLFVIEGADCCGRSTQIGLLKEWLEQRGHAVLDTGLKRSSLMAKMITEAKQGNTLGRTTLSMLYATDLADQIETNMVPALRAGFVVLADRYIFTMMARDLVRGAKKEWLEGLFGFALVPDRIMYLRTTTDERLHRALCKDRMLDYWESGMDMGLAPDRFTSFRKYQSMLDAQYARLADQYGFHVIDGMQPPAVVQADVQAQVKKVLEGGEPVGGGAKVSEPA